MRILMTGATGLIGRELGKALVARGDTLVCLVRDVNAARWLSLIHIWPGPGCTGPLCRRAGFRLRSWQSPPCDATA